MSINKEILTKNLNSKYSFEIVESLDSTMDYIKKYAKEDKFNHIVIAREQVKGRGRNGKDFISPKDSGLYMSLILKLDVTLEELMKLSIITSTAIYSAIKDLYNIDLQLKWVNDLILDDMKVGGILCESSVSDTGKVDYITIGIGINIEKYEFPSYLENIVSSIKTLREVEIDKTLLIAKIIDYLELYLDNKSDYLEVYKSASYVLGKEIEVINNNEKFSAVAILINKYGHLLVDKSGEMIPLNSGEISIRKK